MAEQRMDQIDRADDDGDDVEAHQLDQVDAMDGGRDGPEWIGQPRPPIRSTRSTDANASRASLKPG